MVREEMKNQYRLCGYCEYGYRLFHNLDTNEVLRLPLPYVFTKYFNGRCIA